MAICDFCGSSSPEAGPSPSDPPLSPADHEDVPLTWLVSVEGGKRLVYCERCARDHLRSIEAKLDSQWW